MVAGHYRFRRGRPTSLSVDSCFSVQRAEAWDLHRGSDPTHVTLTPPTAVYAHVSEGLD